MTTVTVGIDLVDVTQVTESIAAFGPRYTDRVFTAHERDSSTGTPAVRSRALAARFAAKEATIKALRPGAEAPRWLDMEVRKDPAGWCEIRLSGSAQLLAAERGVSSLSVSLSHESNHAVAVVIAIHEGEAG